MKFVSDLHLHSRFARACSKDLNFDTLSKWGKMKGIQLLSSADFTHPEWFKETKEHLKELGNGFHEYNGVKFVIGGEISCIYSQGGKVRRIHVVVLLPSLDSASKVNVALSKIGNIHSDGRPIIGISARNLASLILGIEPKAIIIPAHIWTPWFSLYGSNSGFDSIEECFGDTADSILAVETGLSSDPNMNWRIKELDKRSIVSFSDAHSAPKMSREVTVFDGELSYQGLVDCLKNQQIAFTVEFFPEEGKYHYTGHRNCNIKHSPTDSEKLGVICPQCQRKLTVGVMHRVGELADRTEEEANQTNRPPYRSLVPLLEIVAEAIGGTTYSQKVKDEYLKLVSNFGSELGLLLKTPIDEIERFSHPRIAEGVDKVRRGDIVIDPGYDGVFGVVKIWEDAKKAAVKDQTLLKTGLVIDEGQLHLF